MPAFTFFHKDGDEWRVAANAVERSLQLSYFATSLGRALVALPLPAALWRLTTHGVLLWEGVGWMLLFAPIARRAALRLFVVGTALLHVALALTLHLGTFSPTCLAAAIVFWPAADVARRANRRRRRRPTPSWRVVVTSLQVIACLRSPVLQPLELAAARVCVVAALRVVLLQRRTRADAIAPRRCLASTGARARAAHGLVGRLLTRRASTLSPTERRFHLHQHWSMFAPHPPRFNAHHIVRLTLVPRSGVGFVSRLSHCRRGVLTLFDRQCAASLRGV